MGQAGPAGRNHPADRDRQIEAGHRKIPLGPDRRHGVQPGRRKSRDRRGDGRVPNTRLREAGTWRRRCRLATRFGCELLHIGALGVRPVMDGSTLSRKGYGHGQSTDALRAFRKRHSRYLRNVQPVGATSVQLSRRLSGQELHR